MLKGRVLFLGAHHAGRSRIAEALWRRNAGDRFDVASAGRERLYWPFENPPGAQGTEAEPLQKFREIRDQIEGKIDAGLATKTGDSSYGKFNFDRRHS